MSETGFSELEVADRTYLLEKVASECSPLQYVRELTVNAIQAIEARKHRGVDFEGRIIWDVDWAVLENSGDYKLQISDNGTGMTGPEMDRFIRNLSSSGREQSFTQNFGMGAKVTAGVLNPRGVAYKSWVDGAGTLAVFCKDETLQKYGLKHHQLPDGTSSRTPSITDDLKCEPIEDCGTAVTLMGKQDDENTVKPASESSKRWLIYYLNTRFFEIPDGITIKVREFNNSEPEFWPKSKEHAGMFTYGETYGSAMKTIKGQKRHLDETPGVVQGVVELATANIRWFILPSDISSQHDIWANRAHTAALYQGELYEMRPGKQAYGRLRDFGVIFGYDRVILYAEPKVGALNFAPNTARSQLLVEGEPLPWEAWAAEFRQRLPKEIKEMMDEITSSAEGKNHKEAIKRRLKEIQSLFTPTRYRRTARGQLLTDGVIPGGTMRMDQPHIDRGRTSSGRPSGGGKGADPYGAFLRAGGESATETQPRVNFPDVQWVSVIKRTRSDNDDLEDRAARYSEIDNTIYANEDFRIFNDLITEAATRYPGAPATEVKRAVQEWLEQQLTEAVLGVQAMKSSPAWDPKTLEAAVSSEALTTAVLPRYSTLKMITRSLGARFGASAGEGRE